MSLLASIAMTLILFAYIFWPERNPFLQADKTRVDYLRERKESIYDNLRDLNFEYLAGKYPEQDYAEQRAGLEDEAAAVMAEMEALEARGIFAGRGRRDPKSEKLAKAFDALASMPDDFYREGRIDSPPQERDGL